MPEFETRNGFRYFADRGPNIVLEGSDGTGKSLQANRLTNRLIEMGFDPLIVPNPEKDGVLEPIQEPGGTEYANGLREILKYSKMPLSPWEEVELFTKARKSNWQELMNQALEDGRPVITARNFVSTVAYQGYGKGVPIDHVLDYTKENVGSLYMRPDVLCVLALESEITRRERLGDRGIEKKDRFESLSEDFQERVKEGYIDFAKKQHIPILMADGTPDEVEALIWEGSEQTSHSALWRGVKYLFDLDA